MSENEARVTPDGEARNRVATIVRETGESRIAVTVNLDGTGKAEIDTPIGFLKHMLSQIARHGMIDLKVEANGDLETGSHHTVEDTAIVLGRAIDEALGDRKGIVRMADRTCPLERRGAGQDADAVSVRNGWTTGKRTAIHKLDYAGRRRERNPSLPGE